MIHYWFFTIPKRNMAFQPLENPEDLRSALDQSNEQPVVLFKHSATCSLSARADKEMRALVGETDSPLFKVVVQKSRRVSDTVEQELGIRHESPQAIIVRNGRGQFHASHRNVRAGTFKEKLKEAA